jgi:hypothetical protein
MFTDTNESPITTTTILSTSTLATSSTTLTNEIIVIAAKSCTKGPKNYFVFTKVFNLQGSNQNPHTPFPMLASPC